MDVEQLKRYNRQIILPDIGRAGQEKLVNAKVLCIGAGGLGSPASLYLAAAGIGTLGVIDMDDVDLSNLQRQILFASSDAGRPKAEAAHARLTALNPLIKVRCHNERLCADNAERIISQYDVVLDGSDNFSTKFLANDCAVKLGIPLVYGSILGFDGQAAVFWAKHGPCYRCMYPQPPKGYIPNCAEAGVIGAVAGMIGSLQALEVVKLIVTGEEWNTHHLRPLIGKLWLVSTANLQQTLIDIPKNPNCPICSQAPEAIQLEDTEMPVCATAQVPGLYADQVAKHPRAMLIDVRTPKEFQQGHLSGARNIPLDDLPQSPLLDELDKEACYILCCQSGSRSQRGATVLIDRGFKEVYNLSGGLAMWPGELAR